MLSIKRILGLLWMVLGPAAIGLLVWGAIKNIGAAEHGDINKPLPWIIIIAVFAPVAAGLTVFGLYAWKGEYDAQPSDSGEKDA